MSPTGAAAVRVIVYCMSRCVCVCVFIGSDPPFNISLWATSSIGMGGMTLPVLVNLLLDPLTSRPAPAQ